MNTVMVKKNGISYPQRLPKSHDFDIKSGAHIHPVAKKKKNGFYVEAENIDEGKKVLRKKLKREGCDVDSIMDHVKIDKNKHISHKLNVEFNVDANKYRISVIKMAYEYTCEIMGESYYNDNIACVLRRELLNAIENHKVDDKVISDYCHIMDLGSRQMLDNVKNSIENSQLDIRHLITIYTGKDGKILCSVMLFMESAFTFTVLMSDDATLYSAVKLPRFTMIDKKGEKIDA